MLKKLVSAVCLWALLASVVVVPAYAGTVIESMIQSIVLSVPTSTPSTFNPGAGQTLQTAVTYVSGLPANTNGYVNVIQGSTVVKTLATWTNSAPKAPIDWDGKAIETTGQVVCGSTGAVCPVGDYQIETEVDYLSGADTHQDKQIKNFSTFCNLLSCIN